MSTNSDLNNKMSPGVPPNRSGEQTALAGFTWGTQAISDLVGITVHTLRYYHQVGLLREPKRTTKGLPYDETHLLTLLRIKRFSMTLLTFDEIVDIIYTPTSPRVRRILLELDRTLADRVAEIGNQRRTIRGCLCGSTPVDVPPRSARHLATLRQLGDYDTTAVDKTLEELAAGYDSEEAARVVGAVIQDPIVSRLSVFEERLRRINENLRGPELTDLAKDYGQLLVDLHTVNAQAGLKSVSGHSLVEAIGLAESTTSEREREVPKQALTILVVYVDGAGQFFRPMRRPLVWDPQVGDRDSKTILDYRISKDFIL